VPGIENGDFDLGGLVEKYRSYENRGSNAEDAQAEGMCPEFPSASRISWTFRAAKGGDQQHRFGTLRFLSLLVASRSWSGGSRELSWEICDRLGHATTLP